jgi:hypothetical protein
MRYIRLILLATTLALSVYVSPAFASTAPARPVVVSHPDVSSQAAASRFAADPAEAVLARGFVTINRAGDFVVARGYKGHVNFAGLNAARHQWEAANHAPAIGVITAQAFWCYWMPNWALDTYAWIIIIYGGIYATASFFVDVTVIGIPLGAVIGALGIWTGVTGYWLLWYFDKYYPNGGWVCFT